MTVSVRELNQNTSAVLQRAEAGESLIISSHGRPVARLIPFVAEGAFQALVAAGQVILPQPRGEWNPLSLGCDVDELLAFERSEAL
ncbi:MAG: type II toxin-antitoxin system prevent-host-death family antitoxin [Propionibacteriaceae bacterium]|nr:type II toxin-antitoxin system prevent-host-death family antitoxin [Propionibacteriaceae bacterium]